MMGWYKLRDTVPGWRSSLGDPESEPEPEPEHKGISKSVCAWQQQLLLGPRRKSLCVIDGNQFQLKSICPELAALRHKSIKLTVPLSHTPNYRSHHWKALTLKYQLICENVFNMYICLWWVCFNNLLTVDSIIVCLVHLSTPLLFVVGNQLMSSRKQLIDIRKITVSSVDFWSYF